jgi:cobalt/nickel transport system ATP-binding protein
MEDTLLYEIQGLSYSYLDRFPALNSVDLSIREGERIGLLGANGSGKSTLLLVLAGLIFPPSGSVKYQGKALKEESFTDISFQRSFRKTVGIVFQNPDMQLFNSSVEEELFFGLMQLRLDKREIEGRVRKYSALMEIEHLLNRSPQYLSIGEKKKVAIASVFVMEPEILLLDEPSAGLDPRTSRSLVDAINVFWSEGRAVITATQDMHIVSEIADRIMVLSEDKRIAGDGKADIILADRKFLEEHNLVHSHTHRHKGITHLHAHEHTEHHHFS